jgi:pimeloyl-ACP methyl ester carboxylesterase
MNSPKMLNSVPAGERPIAYMEHFVTGAKGSIIFFPGLGEGGDGTINTLPVVENVALPKYVKQNKFSYSFNVLTPQLYTDPTTYGREWPLYYMRSMIDYANTLTPGKVFIMGMSLGGGAVWNALDDEYCCKKIIGAVPICGTSTFNDARYVKQYNIPVVGIHGYKDGTIGFGNTTAFISVIGDPLGRLLIYSDLAHNIWDQATDPQVNAQFIYISQGSFLLYPLQRVSRSIAPIYEWFLTLANADQPVPVPTPIVISKVTIHRADGSTQEII